MLFAKVRKRSNVFRIVRGKPPLNGGIIAVDFFEPVKESSIAMH